MVTPVPITSIPVTPRISIPVTDVDDTSFLAQAGQGYNGVVDIYFNGSSTGTGALLSDGLHILTAAHLWSDPTVDASTISVRFEVMNDSTDYVATSYVIHESYNSTTLDHDVALIKLSQSAPSGADKYELYTASDEVGQTMTIVGYGLKGTGFVGEDSSDNTPLARVGQNRVDALNDAINSAVGTTMPAGTQLIFDFDNGSSANDAGALIGAADTGLGNKEVNTTRGDSGGPSFIDGKIAGVTSYGQSATGFGFSTETDIDATVNSTFGEFSSNTRVSYYADWINTNAGITTTSTTPTMTIANASVAEGDSGTTNLTFTVSLSSAATSAVTVIYTVDESTGSTTQAITSSLTGQDVQSTSDTLTIAAGATSGTFTVPIIGDTTVESDETFTVSLTSVNNAQFTGGASSIQATGTITNDDTATSTSDGGLTTAQVEAVRTVAQSVAQNSQGYWEATFAGDYTFIYVPQGDFLMGSNTLLSSDSPQRTVTLDGYWISKHEVSIAQFTTFVNAQNYVTDVEQPGSAGPFVWNEAENSFVQTPGSSWKSHSFTQETTHPVVNVSYNDGIALSGYLTTNLGVTVTLPTEAQWEKAGRGTDGRLYPWGNDNPDGTKANYADTTFANKYGFDTQGHPDTSANDGYAETAPIGSFTAGASPYGVLDMAGNVAEWVLDYYDESYYQTGPTTNPTGPTSGDSRGNRGGNWVDSAGRADQTPDEISGAHNIRIASRTGDTPTSADDHLGLRLVAVIPLETTSTEIPASTSTTSTVTLGSTATGDLETTADRDWFGVALTAGTTYTLEVRGANSSSGTLDDPFLRLYDSSGSLQAFIDDGGTGFDSLLSYTPTVTGTFYISAGAFNDASIGTYTVAATANSASTTTPTLTVAASSVTEGNSGTSNMTFTATLSAAASSDVTVTYTTDESLGSSTEAITSSLEGQDVQATSDTLTIAAGQTTGTFTIPVIGDTTAENNETFTVTLNSLTNAQFSGGASSLQVAGTIIDDDTVTQPALSIADASVTEADSFNQTMTFTVTLSAAATSTVTVDYATSNGTATAGTTAAGSTSGTSDYTAASGTLSFAAGETSKTFTVSVTGDIAIEENETFTVTLSNASNATISDATATGTITENEVSVWSGQAYVDANPDLVTAGVTASTALDHYAAFGYAENRLISFDATAYLEVNPDVASAGITTTDAITHYINFGKNENRPFSADAYLNANPDLVLAGFDSAGAGAHFANFGKNEGRLAGFDSAGYALANSDLGTAQLDTVQELIDHYRAAGQSEGRPIFDPGQYFAANVDVASAGANAYFHYQNSGIAEGRPITKQTTTTSSFDVEGLG